MSSSPDGHFNARPPAKPVGDKSKDPEWTSSLKRLYDSVVDEPLPDSFKNLLSQLDAGGDK